MYSASCHWKDPPTHSSILQDMETQSFLPARRTIRQSASRGLKLKFSRGCSVSARGARFQLRNARGRPDPTRARLARARREPADDALRAPRFPIPVRARITRRSFISSASRSNQKQPEEEEVEEEVEAAEVHEEQEVLRRGSGAEKKWLAEITTFFLPSSSHLLVSFARPPSAHNALLRCADLASQIRFSGFFGPKQLPECCGLLGCDFLVRGASGACQRRGRCGLPAKAPLR